MALNGDASSVRSSIEDFIPFHQRLPNYYVALQNATVSIDGAVYFNAVSPRTRAESFVVVFSFWFSYTILWEEEGQQSQSGTCGSFWHSAGVTFGKGSNISFVFRCISS